MSFFFTKKTGILPFKEILLANSINFEIDQLLGLYSFPCVIENPI